MPEYISSSPGPSSLRSHLRRIFLLIYRVLGDVDTAQQLTQETFIEVLQASPSSAEPSSLGQESAVGSRLTEAAVRQIAKHLSEGSQESVAPSSASSLSVLFDRGSSSESHLRLERRLGLDGGLAELTETERLIMLLRDVESFSAARIARNLNCSVSTVHSQLARARLKFTAYVGDRH